MSTFSSSLILGTTEVPFLGWLSTVTADGENFSSAQLTKLIKTGRGLHDCTEVPQLNTGAENVAEHVLANVPT